jgi:hypothetical protein
MVNLTKQDVQGMIDDSAKKSQYSTAPVSFHTHNGIDSPTLPLSSTVAGVAQIVGGTNVTISPSGGTGVVTINASGGSTGVTSLTAGSGVTLSAATGAVIITNTGVTSLTGASGITVSQATGAVIITANGGGNSFATSQGSISNVTGLNLTTTPQNNDTVVTHSLGTTPKLITISITTFQVPGNASGSAVYTYATLYLVFNTSGSIFSGYTNYYVTGNTQLVNGGATNTYTQSSVTNSGTMTISLVSVGSTTFTFRITYSCANGNTIAQGNVTGITYGCQG